MFTGGLQAIADLLQLENESQSVDSTDMYSITLRRYSCMVLTNLTYGDADNKSLLCTIPGAVGAIVAQLGSSDEELKQVRVTHRMFIVLVCEIQVSL
jgi:adenomatosis polyposis coli protein